MSKDNATAAMLMAIIASIYHSSNIIFVIISICLPFWQRELSSKTILILYLTDHTDYTDSFRSYNVL